MHIREEPNIHVSARMASHLGTTEKISLKAVSGEHVIFQLLPQDFSINIT